MMEPSRTKHGSKVLSFRRFTPGRIARKISRTIFHKDHIDYRGMRLPLREDRRVMSGDAFGSDEWFLQSGIVEALRLGVMGFKPGQKIVDVGSGLGRLATGLIWEFGDQADYTGLEIKREYVDWCQKHIQSFHPSYRFIHIDVANERYNPSGSQKGTDQIKFPLGDGEMDIVYLWGVFTNMGPEEVLAYVSEIKRVLKPGGKAFVTGFIEYDVPEVSFNPSGYGPYEHDGSPLLVVRYSFDFLLTAFAKNDLKLDEFRHRGGHFPYHSEVYLSKFKAG